jgi:hypothetical protein
LKYLKSTLIVLLLASIILVGASGLLAGKAEGYANFTKWANRSARILEPADYNTNGTCSCAVCCWKGVQGIGNMGIGNGNVSLMKPDVINSMVQNATGATNGNETSGNASNEMANETAMAGNAAAGNDKATPGNYTDTIIRAPASNTPGNGTLVSRDTDASPAEPEPAPEAAPEAPLTESLYPDFDLAASVIPRSTPYSITINQPFPHILAEDPREAAALYGKLIGLPMPSGQVIDVGVKSIGYEY